MRPLLRGLLQEGIDFHGLLYPGLMITSQGPRVLEFNCRFGDPETQALLPRMKSDLLPLLESTIDGKINTCAVEWDPRRRSHGRAGVCRLSWKIRNWEIDLRSRRCGKAGGRPDFSRGNETRERENQDRGWPRC